MFTSWVGARIERGKEYAESGKVFELTIERGLVRARVSGSRRKPYEVEIEFQTLTESAWERIAARLRDDAVLRARVLCAGVENVLPQEFEQIFESEGTPLFPKFESGESMNCSCPDKSVPCKHLVAVFFLLERAFERDPFLILKLRGMEREQFFASLEAPKIELKNLEINELAGEIPTFPIPDVPKAPPPIKKLAPVYARASEYASGLISRGTP